MVYTLALKYSLYGYIGPKVYTIWVHGPLGKAWQVQKMMMDEASKFMKAAAFGVDKGLRVYGFCLGLKRICMVTFFIARLLHSVHN